MIAEQDKKQHNTNSTLKHFNGTQIKISPTNIKQTN